MTSYHKTISNTERTDFASRTGTRATVFEVRRDPSLNNKNILHNKSKQRFPFVEGSKYKGQWKDNHKDGFGVQMGADNSKYEGEWKLSKRHGRGTLWVKKENKSVKQYAGEWAEDNMEGYGFYYYDTGDVYRGQWQKNKRSGKGLIEYTNGDVFEGEWLNDMKHGPGILYLQNGNIYDGHWIADMKEGPGRFYYASTKKIYEGEWVQDAPRCGEFRDPLPEEESRFGEPTIRKEKFKLPELMLENSRTVYDNSVTVARVNRSIEAGIDRGIIEEDNLRQGERVFSSLMTSAVGLAPLSTLRPVFESLGVDITDELLDDIMNQFDIFLNTELSFPEVVDIASFIICDNR